MVNEAIQNTDRGMTLLLKPEIKKMVSTKNILSKMLQPDEGEIENFVPTLHKLSENSLGVSKKVSRNYLNITKNSFWSAKDPTVIT